MQALGYKNWPTFKKNINRAIGACTTVGISVAENFIQHFRDIDGKTVEDLKLSRFACCLTALNGDPKKPRIAASQAYFVSLAIVLQDLRIERDSVDRLVLREEISDREVTLSKVTGLHHRTVIKLLIAAGQRCEVLLASKIQNVPVTDVQCDEIWSYVYKKESRRVYGDENFSQHR